MITDHGGVNNSATELVEAVLSALDKTLIPSAQNAELKSVLVKVRPAFAAHLDMAKQLQSELSKSGG